MTTPHKPDHTVLPEPLASRVLERASELDAAQRTGTRVADLRAAAAEAGISQSAFDAAVKELEREQATSLDDSRKGPRRRYRIWALGAIAATITLVMWAAFRAIPMGVAAVQAEAALVEQAVVLRCIPAAEATQLIRPVLNLPGNTIVVTKGAPRVLTIRATSEQLQQVKAILDQSESAASCART
jgi:hypothetical protein